MTDLLLGCFPHAQPYLATPGTQIVRISLGKPKWYPGGGDALPFVPQLAPAPWYFREPDQEVWERRYRHQLHRTTANRIYSILNDIAEECGAERLILCCFEQDPMDCHRSMFGRWWIEQMGEVLLDLTEVEPLAS